MKLRVPEDAAGERLDRYLARLAEVGSRAEAERLVAAGLVLVEGVARPKSHRLAGGEELELSLPSSRPSGLEPETMELDVVWEDAHLLVVDKPAGLVVHPGAGHATGTLVHGLLALEAEGGEDPERPGIVHRLDRDTSGLLVVARTDAAHRALQEAIRERRVTREYLALVRGRPRSRRGRIEAPIGRDRRDPTRMSLDTATPREAVTLFEVEELLPRHALLRVTLETGRTHQIRVHLAAVGLPVAGDPVYGVAGDLGLVRQFLHAARLAFDHPVTGEPVDVRSPLPPELEAALAQARGA
ncbi:MAG TPA: RluA family pseudouridine synthase [Gaiellaceae bacterium]|nr:RluA family pseudouridine synthase [Gaiellaceae bacterium]